jgi:hypothetical protein
MRTTHLDVKAIRLSHAITAFIFPLFGLISRHPQIAAVDPLIERLILSAIALTFVLFMFHRLGKAHFVVGHSFLIYTYTFWLIRFAFINQLSLYPLFLMILMTMGGPLAFNSVRKVKYYSASLCGGVLLLFPFAIAPHIHPALFISI